MNYVIATYPDYNERRYGTPWAAPCDSTGRPNFKAPNVGHFSGGHGKGGDLFAEDPKEGSVWAFGQKDYKGKNTEKNYAVYKGGEFQIILPSEVMDALNQAPQEASIEKRKEEIIRLLFARVSNFEGDRFGEAMRADGITKAEAEAYGFTWEDEE